MSPRVQGGRPGPDSAWRRVVLHVDLIGAARCEPEFLSVDAVLRLPADWDDDRVRRAAVEHYGVPLEQVGQPVEVDCATCHDTGWVCAGTTTPADFERGTCCNPSESEEFSLGPGCPSADGCPDCDRALAS